jgi:transposase
LVFDVLLDFNLILAYRIYIVEWPPFKPDTSAKLRGRSGVMSGYDAKSETTVEVIQMVQRRRWTAGEKIRMIEESMLPGMNVSFVARRHGVNPNLLFRWRKLMTDGGKTAVNAGGEVVSASEVHALKKQIRELERLLGKKTMEVEILREAVEIAHEKKLILRSPLFTRDGSQ